MEIIVRLHRFVRDKLQDRRIAFLPHPVAWTEVPETLESLRKQRGRWYRGLRESLRYHRAMLWRRKFGRIGWFALPTFWVFEYLGPLVELCGYVLVLFSGRSWSTLLGYRFVDYDYLWAFLLASLGYGMLVNVFAVLVGAWRFRLGLADRLQRGLAALQPPPGRADAAGVRGARERRATASSRCTGGCAARGTRGGGRPAGKNSRGWASAKERRRRMADAPGPRVLVVDDDP